MVRRIFSESFRVKAFRPNPLAAWTNDVLPVIKPIARWLNKNDEVITAIKNAVSTMHEARAGGPVTKVLAGMSITGSLVRCLAGSEYARAYLKETNYDLVQTCVGGFLVDIIALSPCNRMQKMSYDDVILYWGENDEIAALYNEEMLFSNGPYVLGGDDSLLTDMIIKTVWQSSSDITMVDTGSLESGYKRSNRYILSEIPDPGPYIGTLDIDHYVKRANRYKLPMTLLIEGPSRVGKSVLARHISSRIAGLGNTLKIAGSSLAAWDANGLLSILKYLQPSILLIDDIDMSRSDDLLAILETLRSKEVLTIITEMTEVGAKNRGGKYIPGMGPGRIDEVLTLPPPSAEDRDLIFRHYYAANSMPVPQCHSELVERTDGVTGGYIKEIARRLDIHGEESWEEELESILYFAPPENREDDGPESREEEEEEDDEHGSCAQLR